MPASTILRTQLLEKNRLARDKCNNCSEAAIATAAPNKVQRRSNRLLASAKVIQTRQKPHFSWLFPQTGRIMKTLCGSLKYPNEDISSVRLISEASVFSPFAASEVQYNG
jgi:hypothetical protein